MTAEGLKKEKNAKNQLRLLLYKYIRLRLVRVVTVDGDSHDATRASIRRAKLSQLHRGHFENRLAVFGRSAARGVPDSFELLHQPSAAG